MRRGNALVCERSSGFETDAPGQAEAIPRAKTAPPAMLSLSGMFFGRHPKMEQFRGALPKIAACDLPVLIQGETGTGKEVLARYLHRLSPRANKPFIKLNCAAIPGELAESELFGYERGAFTGAFQRKPGIFEMANGGTVMLDEIGDMEYPLQAKLLQVLQDQEFRRVGGTDVIKVDVRVISATHHNLAPGGHNNPFRMDLFYRLNGFSFTVPSLRDRREDVLELAEFLYRRHGGVGEMPRSPAFEQALISHDWPGNIRELETVIRKLIVLEDPDALAAELHTSSLPTQTIPQNIQPIRSQLHAPVSLLAHASRTKDQTETAAIRSALAATRWNRRQAAALVGLEYKALLYKMKKLSIG